LQRRVGDSERLFERGVALAGRELAEPSEESGASQAASPYSRLEFEGHGFL
jgi:hypothetical protein